MSFVNNNPTQSKWESSSDEPCEYFLAKFDARGNLINEEVEEEIQRELNDITYTDVVIIAHGYSTKLQEDGSHGVANRIVPSFTATIPPYRKPLYVAVSWPSDVPTTLLDGDDKAPYELAIDLLKDFVGILAKGGNPILSTLSKVWDLKDNVQKLNDLIEKLKEKTAREKIEDRGELPDDVCSHIAEVFNGLRKQSSQSDGSTKTVLCQKDVTLETVETVKDRFRSYREKLAGKIALKQKNNEKGNVSAKEAPSDTVIVDKSFSIGAGVATVVGAASTVKNTYDLVMTLFDVIYTTMERRATVVGSRGLHDLMANMMNQAKKRVRFHLYSHSMGAHVVQSAALGRDPTGNKLTRKIHTLFMAQAACSTDVYAKGGPYRPLVSKLRPIAGPICATIMKDDEALHFYDAFLTKPLGKFGFFNHEPFKKQEINVIDVPPEKENQLPLTRVVFEKNTVYNLRAKAVISDHGDVNDKELSSLFWQAASLDLTEKDYVVTDPTDLPQNYWTDYEVRNEGKLQEGWFWQ